MLVVGQDANGVIHMENKIRLRFSKTGKLRFIGHLDFLRVFQQAIRRSGLPIAYSQGFNPHQIISFALPLPLGMESINDYADVTLTTSLPPEQIVNNLNGCAPQGLHVSAAYKPVGAAAAAATVAADYVFDLQNSTISSLQAAAEKILGSETLIIPKKTKSGIKNTDIRPDIYEIHCAQPDSSETLCKVHLRLSAGSAKFLNPLVVAELLLSTNSNNYEIPSHSTKPCTSTISRIELYQANGKGGFATL